MLMYFIISYLFILRTYFDIFFEHFFMRFGVYKIINILTLTIIVFVENVIYYISINYYNILYCNSFLTISSF